MPAQSRGADGGEIQMFRHAQREGFIHDHAVGITAVGHAAGNFVRGVVGERGAGQAKLLQVFLAVFAGAAGIHHAADGGDVAFLEFFDVRAGLDDAADDFVAGHAGISRRVPVPFIARDVDVGVADAAEKNLRSARRARPGRGVGS